MKNQFNHETIYFNYETMYNKIDSLNLSKNTINNLRSFTRRLQTANIKTSEDIHQYLHDIRDGKNKEAKQIQPSTYAHYLKSALSLMTHEIIPPSSTRTVMNSELKNISLVAEKNRTVVPSEKQQSAYIPLKKLQEKVKNIPELDKRLLVSLYVDIPPVRLDYANVKIVSDETDIPPYDKNNYYALKQNTVTLKDYKTKSLYGDYKYKLLASHATLIKKSLDINPREYLFTNKYGEPHSNNTFGKYLNQVFKEVYDKSITLLDLRHIYASHHSIEKYPQRKLDTIASRMLHSGTTNALIYQKEYA